MRRPGCQACSHVYAVLCMAYHVVLEAALRMLS